MDEGSAVGDGDSGTPTAAAAAVVAVAAAEDRKRPGDHHWLAPAGLAKLRLSNKVPRRTYFVQPAKPAHQWRPRPCPIVARKKETNDEETPHWRAATATTAAAEAAAAQADRKASVQRRSRARLTAVRAWNRLSPWSLLTKLLHWQPATEGAQAQSSCAAPPSLFPRPIPHSRNPSGVGSARCCNH